MRPITLCIEAPATESTINLFSAFADEKLAGFQQYTCREGEIVALYKNLNEESVEEFCDFLAEFKEPVNATLMISRATCWHSVNPPTELKNVKAFLLECFIPKTS